MKTSMLVLFCFILAVPAFCEVSREEELRVIDVTTNYLVDHPFPYYRHHWKVIVAAESRLRFEPRFIPEASKASRPEAFAEATADVAARNGGTIPLEKAPEGLGFAPVAQFETAAGYDWETLYKEHFGVDAVVEMSRPGFDSSGTFAVVVSHTANASGGNSATVCQLARDESGHWSVIGSIGSPGIRRPAVPQN